MAQSLAGEKGSRVTESTFITIRQMNNLLKICLIGITLAVVAIFICKVPPNSVLFFGFLLACPLMHFAMGHGQKDHKPAKHH